MKKICCLVLSVFVLITVLGGCNIKNENLNILETLPTMTKENEEYYNKYLKIFDYKSPFRYSFSENIFEYFPTEYIYSKLNKDTNNCYDLQSSIVDEYLKNYFPISSEQLHSLSKSYEERISWNRYLIPVVQPDNSFVGIVTDNQKKDNTLILNCDWYQMISDNPVRYEKWSESVITIELTDDNWFYVSNDSNRIYKENDIPESIKIDEYGLPKMTTEHQSYYDKYIGFFKGHLTPFCFEFSENDFNAFYAGEMYPYLAVNDNTDSIDKFESATHLPLDTVENKILKYFPMTKEYCREETGLVKGIGYHQDEQYYDIDHFHKSTCNRGTVNKVVIEDDIIKLHCDWYKTGWTFDTKDPNDTKEKYSYYVSSILIIKVNDDNSWKYISNEVTNRANNRN